MEGQEETFVPVPQDLREGLECNTTETEAKSHTETHTHIRTFSIIINSRLERQQNNQ